MAGTTRTVKRWRWVGVLVSVVLAAAACGDDTTTTTDETSAAAPTAEGTPLRIGVLANVTGEVTIGEKHTPVVLEAWADAINADGGVAGHPVEFVIEDTRGDAATATAAAQRVVDDQSIVAVVMFDVNAEAVYAETITEAGLPVIGGAGVSPVVWNELPNWLSLTTSFPSILNGSMVLGHDLDASTAAYVVCAEVPTCAEIGPVAEAAAEALGLDYAGTPRLAADAPDYTAECIQARNDEIDYIVLGHAAAVDMRFAADCQTQGYAGDFAMVAGGIEPEVLLENDPGVTIDLLLTSFPWWVDDAPVQAYRELMERQGVPETSWTDPHGTAAYATMELFEKTLEANASSLPDTPTADDIITAYGTIQDETLDGLLPQPVTFTPNEAEPPITCYWFAKFENGTFTAADLADPVCDPPELPRG